MHDHSNSLRFRWAPTWPSPIDADTHAYDLTAWDGERRVGRIEFQFHGVHSHRWKWSVPVSGLLARKQPRGVHDTMEGAMARAERCYQDCVEAGA